MLKKLYKHEFYSLFRNILPIYAALLGFALLSRLGSLIKTSNTVVSVFKGLSVTIYIFSIIAVFVVGMVIVVTRFYKNLLSHEGYLTFTLPFSATQHIVCKLICGAVVMTLNIIMLIISVAILLTGTVAGKDFIKGMFEAFNMAADYYSAAQIIGFICELGFMLLVSLIYSILMFYASMAIGQQFKNKVGASVVAYICLYSAVQVISMVVMIPAMIVNMDVFNVQENALGSIQLFFGFIILLNFVLAAVYFFITRHFLTKKLNLE